VVGSQRLDDEDTDDRRRAALFLTHALRCGRFLEWRMSGTPAFRIEQTSRPGWARLAVTGELDISTALTFRRRLRALRATNTPVSLDLSELEFIDSAGARAILDAVAASRNGTWRVEIEPKLSDQARRYFELMKAAGLRADL
jgi:anti-anti-sigma factor